jgi:tetrahydromethanopterin S-methyltransferase subunit G
VRRAKRIIRGMDEETTRNLPQDGVERILASIGSLDARLTSLEEKVDRRLQETRPIWEQVLVRLDGVESRVQSLEGEVSGLREEMRTGFHRVERKIDRLAKDVFEVRTDQLELEKRMDEIEQKTT